MSSAYWSEFSPYGRGTDFPYINKAIQNLIARGRATIAGDTLSMYAARHEDEVDEDLVIQALQEFGTRDNPEARSVSAYDISRLLDFLTQRGVDEVRIAYLEWRYLPPLRHDAGMPALQLLLASDPRTLVQMVETAFRPASARNEERVESSPEDSNLASKAFRLLRAWKVVPGTNDDAVVEAEGLHAWLDSAHELLAGADRTEIDELQIGEIFAHSPEDPDGTFPALPVRDVLEDASDERLDRGFSIGVYNKGGGHLSRND